MLDVKKLHVPEGWVSSLLLSLTTLVTYGPLISQLGFYHDDWYFLWTGQAQGVSGIIALFQTDRPLIGWIYALNYMLLPATPLAWQIYGLGERLLGVLGFFWLLRLLWRDRKVETTLMALLFAIYPGYFQQPDATTFSNLLLAEAAVLFSFACTVKALRSNSLWGKLGFTFLSALLALLYLGIYEVMIGLEVVRVFIIWLERREPSPIAWRVSLKKTLVAALPYLLITLVFLVWRLFIFKSTRHSTNVDLLFGTYAAEQWHAPLAIFLGSFNDMFKTAVLAWFVPFYQLTVGDTFRDLGISVVLAAGVTVPVYFYIRSRRQEMDLVPEPQHLEFLWLGVLILFVTLFPVEAAGRRVLFANQWDRYTFHASIGVSFLVIGALFFALRGRARWIVLLTLIAMSVITQFHSAVFYRDYWKSTRNLWWQMAWRTPQIKPETMLFAVVPAGAFAEGYEIYGPANIIYNPHGELIFGANVLNADTLTKIIKQNPGSHTDRSLLVPDHYENSLIMVVPTPTSCVHVLDNRKIELPGYVEDSLVVHAAAFSKIDRLDVTATPAVPPQSIFGVEPAHAWCYYYEKIDLARQRGDWTGAVALANQAAAHGLTPDDLSEWMPVLEAYATTGDVKSAKHAAAILRSNENTHVFLCQQLGRGPVYPAPYNYSLVDQLLCGVP